MIVLWLTRRRNKYRDRLVRSRPEKSRRHLAGCLEGVSPSKREASVKPVVFFILCQRGGQDAHRTGAGRRRYLLVTALVVEDDIEKRTVNLQPVLAVIEEA